MRNKPPVSRNVRIAQWTIPVLLLVVFGVMSYGPIQKQMRAVKETKSICNFKQLFVALTSYANEQDGLYPTDLESSSPTAEACFTTLLRSGNIDDEATFWNKNNALTLGTASVSSPSNDKSLTENENTTGYVMGLTSRSRTNLPILFDSSTEAGVFNTSVWNGKATIAKLNGSVSLMEISTINGLRSNSNEGVILESRGGSYVDIFQQLPEGTKVLPPQLAR